MAPVNVGELKRRFLELQAAAQLAAVPYPQVGVGGRAMIHSGPAIKRGALVDPRMSLGPMPGQTYPEGLVPQFFRGWRDPREGPPLMVRPGMRHV